MFNVQELEKKWLKHKIKSNISYISIGIIVILIPILFLAYNLGNIKDSAILNNQIKTKKSVDIKKESIDTKKKITLTPSLNFIYKVKIEEPVKIKPTIKPITKKETTIKEEIPKENIKITRKNSSDDINRIIKRFKKSNSPALSLFLAKKYYEMGDYNQAYNYALTTNKLNNNIEASWILFAKSLAKLKKKEKAIKVLKQYIDYSNSNKAKTVLNSINRGEFR